MIDKTSVYDLSGDSTLNYIYTVNVSVGNPPQQAAFMLDTMGTNTFLFDDKGFFDPEVDKFYNITASETGYETNGTHISENKVVGF